MNASSFLPTRRRIVRLAGAAGALNALGVAWGLASLVPLAALASTPALAAPAQRDATLPDPISPAAQRVLRWSRGTGDHGLLAFAIIDKPAARLHVFDAHGQWLGSSPVLLGAARGDHTVPGIGDKPLRDIAPHERTTPAGRFVSEPGSNLKGDEIVWIDYDAAVSLHRVRSVSAAERRAERLRSPGTQDKRISYGCVNVPAAFFDRAIAPHFRQGPGVIYVLPDSAPLADFFAAAAAYEPHQ